MRAQLAGAGRRWVTLPCLLTVLLLVGGTALVLDAGPAADDPWIAVERGGTYGLAEIPDLVAAQGVPHLAVDPRLAPEEVFVAAGRYRRQALLETIASVLSLDLRTVGDAQILAPPGIPQRRGGRIYRALAAQLQPLVDGFDCADRGIPLPTPLVKAGGTMEVGALTDEQRKFVAELAGPRLKPGAQQTLGSVDPAAEVWFRPAVMLAVYVYTTRQAYSYHHKEGEEKGVHVMRPRGDGTLELVDGPGDLVVTYTRTATFMDVAH